MVIYDVVIICKDYINIIICYIVIICKDYINMIVCDIVVIYKDYINMVICDVVIKYQTIYCEIIVLRLFYRDKLYENYFISNICIKSILL